MRLFLVPISTRRAFVYCRPSQTALKTGYLDRITNKSAETWSNWEAAENGWKKKIVTYGQVVLQRIPYEEWGLKSIPPLNAQRQIQEGSAEAKKQPVDVMFPGNAIKQDSVLSVLRTLGTERQDLHRRKMWWCLGIAPLTAPVAILPVIPNIPFFYLAYRGWSHWRAWSGSKHLIHLLDNNIARPYASPELERFYSTRLLRDKEQGKIEIQPGSTPEELDGPNGRERLLLETEDGKELGEILGAPGIAIEVERAVFQIRQRLEAEEQKSGGDGQKPDNGQAQDKKKDS